MVWHDWSFAILVIAPLLEVCKGIVDHLIFDRVLEKELNGRHLQHTAVTKLHFDPRDNCAKDKVERLHAGEVCVDMFGVDGGHRIGEGEREFLLVTADLRLHCNGCECSGVTTSRTAESSVVGGQPTLGSFGELDVEGGLRAPELDAAELVLEVATKEDQVLCWTAVVSGILCSLQ